MAPPSRCNAEQKEFLLKHVSGYFEAQKKGELHKFWVIVHSGWFREWEVVEDASIDDVEERQIAYGEEVASWKKYIKRWYQNHRAAQARVQPYSRLVKQVLKSLKSKRRPQLLEVYCRLFYKDHVLAHVKVEVERLTLLNGKKPTRGQRLRLVRDFAAKYFDEEPQEIKDQVTEVYEKCKEEINKAEEEASKSPEAYAVAIRTIPAQFEEFSQMLSSLTGWKFTLLAGGPDPSEQGRIRSISVHGGENHAGLSFGQVCPEFKSLVSAPFGNFLRTAYTPSECAARALYPVQSDADSTPSSPADSSPISPADSSPISPADSSPISPAVTAAVAPPMNEPPVPMIQPEFEFDRVDEEIDWEALNLFDPSHDGAFRGPPGLSLTDELAGPLFPGFEFDAGLLPQFPSGSALMEPPIPFSPASTDINMSDETIPTQTQPGMTNAPAISAPSATLVAPVSTRSNEPADAVANIAEPASSANTADITTPDKTATPAAATSEPARCASTVDITTPDKMATPADAAGEPARNDGAVDITAQDKTATPADAAGEPARSAGTVGITVPDEAATTGSVSGSSATSAKGKKGKKASAKGANKRTRDPADEALIVPGKRVRKAKDRREVEEFMPQGKENRPQKP